MGRAPWPGLKRLADDASNLVVANLARRAGPRLVVKTIHAAIGKPIAPPAAAHARARSRSDITRSDGAWLTHSSAITHAAPIAAAGMAAVVFGPGDIAQAHTRDEWVSLTEVEQAADILFRLVAQI